MSRADSVILCTGGYDRKIYFWRATTGTCDQQFDMDSHINALAISPKRSLLAAAGNPHIKLFDMAKMSKKPLRTLEGHSNNIISVGFPQDERWMFSASEDGTMKIWDLKNGSVLQEKKAHESKRVMISCAELHPNQGEIVCGDESGTISVWDLAADKMRTVFQCESKPVPIRSLTISQTGSMVVATHKGVCFAYKPAALNPSSPTDDDSSPASGGSATPVSSGVRTGTTGAKPSSSSGGAGGSGGSTEEGGSPDGAFSQWHKWHAHDTYILKTKLSPDGKILATASADGTVKLWDATGSYPYISTLKGHTKWVWDMAFSADSVYMVSASSDKTACLWDLNSSSVLVEYGLPQKRAVTCVALKD